MWQYIVDSRKTSQLKCLNVVKSVKVAPYNRIPSFKVMWYAPAEQSISCAQHILPWRCTSQKDMR